MSKKKEQPTNPIEISKKKRTRFFKGLYNFFDAIMPAYKWPLFGKLGNKIRIHYFRKISPNVSKKIILGKGCEIYPCITIEDNVVIGPNVHLNWSMTIKEGTKIAKDVYFNTQNWQRNPETRMLDELSEVMPIEIGKGCWIGTKAIILRGVTIGDYSTIGAGSVVTKSVPENSMAAGNPAVVKKTYK